MGFDYHFENRDSFASQFIRQKARQLVRHPGFSKSEREDIEQELRIELVLKFPGFDPRRACETTFIARVVENKANSLIRVRGAKKRDFRRDAASLNETVSDGNGGQAETSQTIDSSAVRAHRGQAKRSDEELVQLRLDIAEVLASVPEDLVPTAERLMEMSEYAASRALGQSRRRIAGEVTRLRELFDASDLRDYL